MTGAKVRAVVWPPLVEAPRLIEPANRHPTPHLALPAPSPRNARARSMTSSRGRSALQLQRSRSRRAALPQLQRPNRGRPHVLEKQPAHRSTHHRHLPRTSSSPWSNAPCVWPSVPWSSSPGYGQARRPNPPHDSSSPPSPTYDSYQPTLANQPRSHDRHPFKPAYSNCSTSIPADPAEQPPIASRSHHPPMC